MKSSYQDELIGRTDGRTCSINKSKRHVKEEWGLKNGERRPVGLVFFPLVAAEQSLSLSTVAHIKREEEEENPLNVHVIKQLTIYRNAAHYISRRGSSERKEKRRVGHVKETRDSSSSSLPYKGGKPPQ